MLGNPVEVAWWRNGRALDLRSRGRGFDSWVGAQLRNDCGQVAHTRLPSASEVTTIWRYTNLYIIIIILLLLSEVNENAAQWHADAGASGPHPVHV